MLIMWNRLFTLAIERKEEEEEGLKMAEMRLSLQGSGMLYDSRSFL